MNQRIAIPTNEGKLWQHFGKAPQVTIVNVEDGKIVDQKVLQAPEHEHGAMPRFLAEQGCTDVLCGGIGQGAVNLLNQLGIRIHAGAPELPVEQVLAMFLKPSFTVIPTAITTARDITTNKKPPQRQENLAAAYSLIFQKR